MKQALLWLLTATAFNSLCFFHSAEAQHPTKVPQQLAKVSHVGVLSAGPSADMHMIEVFREQLRDLGYVEGKNITIHYRFAEGNHGRLPELAAELVHLNVDVIFTLNTPASEGRQKCN